MKNILRIQNQAKTIKTYDLLIAGGGLAGICAAVAAARAGVKTALINDRPVLGGNASSEIGVPLVGAANFSPGARETGIIEEIIIEDKVRNHIEYSETMGNAISDNVFYSIVKNEKNIDLYLNTSVRDVLKKGNTIKAIKCSQIGSELDFTFFAKLFIDCTGDGTVGAKAKAKFRFGREARGEFNESLAPLKADKKTMGSSIMFKAIDLKKAIEFIPLKWAVNYYDSEKYLEKVGREHLYNLKTGYWWLEVGWPYNTVFDNEKIRNIILQHVYGIWDHIKNHCEKKEMAKTLALEWVSAIPGKRESRRFEGDHILNQNEVHRRELFADRVAYGGWFMDVHTMGGILLKNNPPEASVGVKGKAAWDEVNVKPYSIPFRSLYSKNINNLMFSGRNISFTHVGMGSPRVMMTCAVMGQAVGTAAAICLKEKLTPRKLYLNRIKELQQQLLKNDAFILSMKNEDEKDLARKATVSASSESELMLPSGNEFVPMDFEFGQIFPVSSNFVGKISIKLRSECKKTVNLTCELCSAKDIWDMDSNLVIGTAAALVSPGKEQKVEFEFNKTVTTNKIYWFRLPAVKGLFIKVRIGSGYKAYLNGVLRRPGLKRWELVYKAFKSIPKERFIIEMKLTPKMIPFKPENIINGVSRTENWTNLWVSDPLKKLPQWIELDLKSPKVFNSIRLSFDTNLANSPKQIPYLKKVPECVKDFKVIVFTGKKWIKVISVKNNYFRHRILNFKPVKASRVRIVIKATNGDRSASIYEVRIYNEH